MANGVTQRVGGLPAPQGPGSIPALYKQVVHTCNPSAQEVEAGGPTLQAHSQLHSLRPEQTISRPVLKQINKI